MDVFTELREAIEEASRGTLIERLARSYGYRKYMIARYIEILGYEDTLNLLEANEEPLPETYRCNDLVVDCSRLRERLEEKGYIVEKIPFLPHGYEMLKEGVGSLGGTHEYLLGYYYIQDPASMSVVYALDPQPGETIVDMAAAPGGKSTQILQLSRDMARLIAVEKNPRRVRSLRSNLQRMRVFNYVIVVQDSISLELPIRVDRALVDAPSTGEGIIRKDPTRKASRSYDDLRVIHEIQYRMLNRALDLVKKDGIVVYSACTLAPEEGELVINRVLEERSDVVIDETRVPGEPGITRYFGLRLDPSVARCRRFWPHLHGTEGFFICTLRREE